MSMKNKKTFKCQICEKDFAQAAHLKIHVKAVYEKKTFNVKFVRRTLHRGFIGMDM
jgi:hypothetical protein